MLLKLDLSKYFDNLGWVNMKFVLLAFGIASSSVEWILNLTSSAFFSILINGVPFHPFSPTQGIRQGDPMSRFLFKIMVEGLSWSIQASIADHTLVGLPLHGIYAPISHNEFVDDTLMMGSPMVQEAHTILLILQTFCHASGMDINKDKSQILFFNISVPVQIHITMIMGFSRSSLLSKYLGIPLLDKDLRNISWEFLLTSFTKILAS